jgi:hypothetical protein
MLRCAMHGSRSRRSALRSLMYTPAMTTHDAVESGKSALADRLARALSIHGFKAKDIGPDLGGVVIAGAWVRKTWNTNRAVVHLCAPPGEGGLGELAQQITIPLGKTLGYFPFFYGLGLQVVWSGEAILDRAAHLERSVDSFDNQRCIVQSLFVVDFSQARYRQARTWGQVITGKYQDAIASCLDEVFVGVP